MPFHLLAGRIKERSVHCNHEGAIFSETTINCNMSEILKDPQYETLGKLLPCSPICNERVEKYAQIVAQFNTFSCCGIALSICFLHKLIDTATMSHFLHSWASIIQGSSNSSQELICGDYNELSSLFPQVEFLPFHQGYHMLTNLPSKGIVSKDLCLMGRQYWVLREGQIH